MIIARGIYTVIEQTVQALLGQAGAGLNEFGSCHRRCLVPTSDGRGWKTVMLSGRSWMFKHVLWIALLTGALMSSASPAEQCSPTPKEINRIEALVTKAAALLESKGKAVAFADFGKRDSEW